MVLSPSLLGFVPWEKTRFNATRFGWFLVCILGGSKFGSCLTNKRAPIRKKLWRCKEVLSLLSGGKDSRPQKLCARYRSSLLLPGAVDC